VLSVGSQQLASYFAPQVLQPSPEAQAAIGLVVEPVERRAVNEVVELQASVDLPPHARAFASTQLPGTLRQIHIDRGTTVSAGDVIAEVESLAFADLQLELLRAHVQAQVLERTVEQLRQAPQAIAGKQLLEAENQYRTLNNRRDSLSRKLETLGVTPAQTRQLLDDRQLIPALPVRAPIDGTLIDFNQRIGQVVQAEEPLFEIHDLAQPLIQAYVSERDVARVRVGQQARIWIELAKKPQAALLYNMLAAATVTIADSEPTLAVPRSAVVREAARSYVFVQQPDGRFQRRAVGLGRNDDRFVEIVTGLQPGEIIATTGAAELRTAYAAVR
jgi:cobalt-zinc-cadmium efflux system membrane fusion protein